MDFFKFDFHLDYILALAFIPVIVNFALLVFNPDQAQKIGKALVFQLGGLLAVPFVIGIFMKLAGALPETMALCILIAECMGAVVMTGFAVPPVRKKEKHVWIVWLLGALTLLMWGVALYMMVVNQTVA